jgi:hypothetical protein
MSCSAAPHVRVPMRQTSLPIIDYDNARDRTALVRRVVVQPSDWRLVPLLTGLLAGHHSGTLWVRFG